MIILQIEHHIQRFEDWKKAFDSDPIDRKKSGVKKYTVYRPTDDPQYVIIYLEFEQLNQAQRTLEALRGLWKNVEGKIMLDPKVRMLEVVESKSY
jgi:hypothetical protein